MKSTKLEVQKAIEIAQDSAEFSETERQVYFAGDIMKMLGIGRSKAYEFLDQVYKSQKPFRVIMSTKKPLKRHTVLIKWL